MNQEHHDKNDNHSLQADLATGWRPRLKIIGPMPLNFDNPQIDKILRPLILSDTSLDQVVYLGSRPRDTFEMHSKLSHQYKYKYRHLLSADYDHLKPFFKKFYSQFQNQYKRPYDGMNQNIQSDLIFDSNFESGNLDCAVRTRKNEFDLFLRVDSNTGGHIMWFYFKITSTLQSSRTVKLNIVNLRNNGKTFYEYCLKPYIKRKGQQWEQYSQTVKHSFERINLHRNVSFFYDEDDNEESQIYRKLSFDLDLDGEEEVQIAYSIPYTYSKLLADINEYRKMAAQNKSIYFDVDYKNQTLSGLDIPYIKICHQQEKQTESKIAKKPKKLCIFIIGRQHPGQSNGSHVLHGFLKELISGKDPSMIQLRKHCNFHVVPMLNPDGVVMGNFRTSLYGKDLNRLFKKNQTLMIPQVDFSRGLAFDLAKQYKKRMLMFLDFHGHSTRKNAFCYAPGFFQTNRLEDIREFPKIIADISDIFRYQSCSFRIAQEKKTTARAVFTKFISLCYTIQTSNWAYVPRNQKNSIVFSQQKWNAFGSSLSRSLSYYFDILNERKLKNQQKNQKNKRGGYSKTVKDISSSKKIKKSMYMKTTQNQQIQSIISKKLGKDRERSQLSVSQKFQPVKGKYSVGKSYGIQKTSIQKSKRVFIEYNEDEQPEIKKYEHKIEEQEGQDEGEDSDNSDQQDMAAGKFKKYINGAAKMFIEFEKAYYGDNYDGKSKIKIDLFKEKKKVVKPIMQQACLRTPSENKNISISIPRKVESTDKSVKKIETKASSQQLNINKMKKDKNVKQKDMKESRVKNSDGGQNETGRKSENPLMSLPRISVINYLAYEDDKNKEGPVFRAPKMDNIYMKNSFRRYG